MFVAVFVLSFMASDYLFTGTVTETWMAIAVITGVLTAIVRWAISEILGPRPS